MVGVLKIVWLNVSRKGMLQSSDVHPSISYAYDTVLMKKNQTSLKRTVRTRVTKILQL